MHCLSVAVLVTVAKIWKKSMPIITWLDNGTESHSQFTKGENSTICWNTGGTWEHFSKWNKPVTIKQWL